MKPASVGLILLLISSTAFGMVAAPKSWAAPSSLCLEFSPKQTGEHNPSMFNIRLTLDFSNGEEREYLGGSAAGTYFSIGEVADSVRLVIEITSGFVDSIQLRIEGFVVMSHTGSYTVRRTQYASFDLEVYAEGHNAGQDYWARLGGHITFSPGISVLSPALIALGLPIIALVVVAIAAVSKQRSLRVPPEGYIAANDVEQLDSEQIPQEMLHNYVDSFLEEGTIDEPIQLEPDSDFLVDQETKPRIVKMIESAESEILIASPWIWGIDEIVDALTHLRTQKMVDVKVLTRGPQDSNDWRHEDTIRRLHSAGIGIEIENKLHAKLIVVDQREVYIGSANLVFTSMSRNLEAGIWTEDPKVVAKVTRYIEDAYNDAFTKRLSSGRQ